VLGVSILSLSTIFVCILEMLPLRGIFSF
jgi:hypothetical protein